MGKGRDRRKKHEDSSKALQRHKRQLLRQQKNKSSKPEDTVVPSSSHSDDEFENGFNNEEAITTVLQHIRKNEMKRKTTVEETLSDPPSPRVNFTLIPHPSEEHKFFLFGGEFWDGVHTTCYNDLFIYDAKCNTWKKVVTPINPSPRSSAQGFCHKHFVYIHGGEFSSTSQSQYLHFKDMWRFDVKSYSWEELKHLRGGPSARSGHRIALWRKHAVVFGGFYDNTHECHYYNDLYCLTNIDNSPRWESLPVSLHGESPHPRSGHVMTVYNDQLFVFGGYFTEKASRFKKKEALVFHDLWIYPLHQVLQHIDGKLIHKYDSKNHGISGNGENADEIPKSDVPYWSRIKLSGIPPPIRCGVGFSVKDKHLYLFGGVVDVETSGGKMLSTFSNDLFVCHLDSKKFYPVILKGGSSHAGDESFIKEKKDSKPQKRSNTKSDDLMAQLEELNLYPQNSIPDEPLECNSPASPVNSNDNHSYDLPNSIAEVQELFWSQRKKEGAIETELPSSVVSAEDLNNDPGKKELNVAHSGFSYVNSGNGKILPIPRMNAGCIILGNHLYIVGGQFEHQSKEITMMDIFILNLRTLSQYELLLAQDLSKISWNAKEIDNDLLDSDDGKSWETGSTIISDIYDMDFNSDQEEYFNNITNNHHSIDKVSFSSKEDPDTDPPQQMDIMELYRQAQAYASSNNNNSETKKVIKSALRPSRFADTTKPDNQAIAAKANDSFTYESNTPIDAPDNDENPPVLIPFENELAPSIENDPNYRVPSLEEIWEATGKKSSLQDDNCNLRHGKKGLKAHKAQLKAQLGEAFDVPTPFPGETEQIFYERTRQFWVESASHALSEGESSIEDRHAFQLICEREAMQFSVKRFEETSSLTSQLSLIEEMEEKEKEYYTNKRREREVRYATDEVVKN